MELIQYIRLFRRWFWLILIGAFVVGAAAFIVRTSQPSVYQAQTTIAVGSYIQAPNPDSAEIRTGLDLARTYAELAKTYDVLQGAIGTLNLPLAVEDLRRMIDIRILTGTSLLVLSVNYSDPVLAADIANEVARQLILHSPTNLTPEQQNQITLANEQITRLNNQMETTRQQLELVDSQLASTEDKTETERLTAQRNALIDQTNQASATIAQFSNTIASLQQRTNSVDIVESARVPVDPSGIGPVSATLLGAAIGATLAGGVVLLFEYLDDKIRTSEDAVQTLALPMLGTVVQFGTPKDDYPKRLIIQPSLIISEASECYRTIRTNLLFAADHEHNPVYLVTSPGPEEGKSVTAANLAVSIALAGMRVLLIDCDLRRPKLHEIFGLKNERGLTTLLFASQNKPPDSLRMDNGQQPDNLAQFLQDTEVPRLKVITSGFIPENPTELLGSVLMRRWMDVFRKSPNIDVVLMDTPPCLLMSDSVALAAATTADVILVLQAARTRRVAAQKAKEQFLHVGSEIKGIVLNSVVTREEDYYGYGYYTYYHQVPVEQIKSMGMPQNENRT